MEIVSTKKALIATLFIFVSNNLFAKDINYDYIEATYSTIKDTSLPVDINAKGISAFGSKSISKNLAMTASVGYISSDEVFGVTVDGTEFDFGILGHASIAQGTDIYGGFSIGKVNTEATDGSIKIKDNDTGNTIVLGLRHIATDSIELEVGVSRDDFFNDISNSFGAGVRFYASKDISIGVGIESGDNVDTYLFKVRLDIQ